MSCCCPPGSAEIEGKEVHHHHHHHGPPAAGRMKRSKLEERAAQRNYSSSAEGSIDTADSDLSERSDQESLLGASLKQVASDLSNSVAKVKGEIPEIFRKSSSEETDSDAEIVMIGGSDSAENVESISDSEESISDSEEEEEEEVAVVAQSRAPFDLNKILNAPSQCDDIEVNVTPFSKTKKKARAVAVAGEEKVDVTPKRVQTVRYSATHVVAEVATKAPKVSTKDVKVSTEAAKATSNVAAASAGAVPESESADDADIEVCVASDDKVSDTAAADEKVEEEAPKRVQTVRYSSTEPPNAVAADVDVDEAPATDPDDVAADVDEAPATVPDDVAADVDEAPETPDDADVDEAPETPAPDVAPDVAPDDSAPDSTPDPAPDSTPDSAPDSPPVTSTGRLFSISKSMSDVEVFENDEGGGIVGKREEGEVVAPECAVAEDVGEKEAPELSVSGSSSSGSDELKEVASM
ncbi:hypothetical protein TeGR_g8401 [Tetraparma gracilis]|uniref:Uncharacterized protein n=1 Tax=Tetraparma gracilis TaxID=2962635 RepID=A0ABQ6MQ20_9STRA|nr:hypothetical protein TeGR_g8401 [Tetraparma gracilis]